MVKQFIARKLIHIIRKKFSIKMMMIIYQIVLSHNSSIPEILLKRIKMLELSVLEHTPQSSIIDLCLEKTFIINFLLEALYWNSFTDWTGSVERMLCKCHRKPFIPTEFAFKLIMLNAVYWSEHRDERSQHSSQPASTERDNKPRELLTGLIWRDSSVLLGPVLPI